MCLPRAINWDRPYEIGFVFSFTAGIAEIAEIVLWYSLNSFSSATSAVSAVKRKIGFVLHIRLRNTHHAVRNT